MSQKQRVEKLVSAGGVVYRDNGGRAEVVICGRASPRTWGLPKGTPNPGESREQTALREVREETGLEVEIEGFIGSVEYRFYRSANSVQYDKTVYFYLMSPTGGDLSLHDHEFDEVHWLPVPEALEALTYDNEVKIVEKSLSLVPGEGVSRPDPIG